MPNTFFIADLHLGHEKTCSDFLAPDGVSPLRPFKNAEEMNAEIIKRWNDIVRPHDKVIVCGDVVIDKKFLPLVGELNGDKINVEGNHDIFDQREYLKVFRKTVAYRVYNDFICSHIPLHPDSVSRFHSNVHGHLHAHTVKTDAGEVDPRYLCVSVEQTNYTPIDIDEVRRRLTQQRREHELREASAFRMFPGG